MLKYITVHMSDPICSCKEENLQTSFFASPYDGVVHLSVSCKLCGHSVIVPSYSMPAAVIFDMPYQKSIASKLSLVHNKSKKDPK